MATTESPSLVQLTFPIQCPIFMIKDTEISALKFRRQAQFLNFGTTFNS